MKFWANFVIVLISLSVFNCSALAEVIPSCVLPIVQQSGGSTTVKMVAVEGAQCVESILGSGEFQVTLQRFDGNGFQTVTVYERKKFDVTKPVVIFTADENAFNPGLYRLEINTNQYALGGPCFFVGSVRSARAANKMPSATPSATTAGNRLFFRGDFKSPMFRGYLYQVVDGRVTTIPTEFLPIQRSMVDQAGVQGVLDGGWYSLSLAQDAPFDPGRPINLFAYFEDGTAADLKVYDPLAPQRNLSGFGHALFSLIQ